MIKKLILILALQIPTICHAGFKIDVASTITATVTSTKILEGVAERNFLLLVNDGAVPVYVKVGSAQSAHEGVTIPAGGNWEPGFPPSDAVYINTASSTASVTVVTGKKL